MRLCGIGSNHTFYKCLRELNEFGYIDYTSTKSSHRAGIIGMKNLESIEHDLIEGLLNESMNMQSKSLNFDIGGSLRLPIERNNRRNNASKTKEDEICIHESKYLNLSSDKKDSIQVDYSGKEMPFMGCTNAPHEEQKCTSKKETNVQKWIPTNANLHHEVCKIIPDEMQKCSPRSAKMPHYIRYKTINLKTYKTERVNIKFPLTPILKKDVNPFLGKRKKVAQKKEKEFCSPKLQEVISFFRKMNLSADEAKRFYFHFESIGWKVGGKTPMLSWESAAQKWMLNSHFYQNEKSNRLDSEHGKNYAEPL